MICELSKIENVHLMAFMYVMIHFLSDGHIKNIGEQHVAHWSRGIKYKNSK